MTVGHIITKIGNFIENRQIFTQLNYNCAKLPNFEDLKTCLGRPCFRGHSVHWSRASLTMCVCLSLVAFPYYCTDPDVSWGDDRRYPLVVQYWPDLQSVHGFRCYDNITPNAKCQRELVLALVPVFCIFAVLKHWHYN